MSNFLKGYRTYLTLILLVVHQLLKILGVDIFTDEQLSTFIDVLLAIIAAIFRYFAKK